MHTQLGQCISAQLNASGGTTESYSDEKGVIQTQSSILVKENLDGGFISLIKLCEKRLFMTM